MRAVILALSVAAILLWPPHAWAASPGPWDQAIAWLFEQQRTFHRELADRLRDLALSGTAGWAMAGMSLAYGVFHAAGPGHGKAVIATYLLTQESHIGRGVRLAVASSFTQGAVAVALVYALVGVADWLPRDTRSAVAWSERLSFAMLALLGAFLAIRALRGLARSFRSPAAQPRHLHAPGCGCGHAPMPPARRADWRGNLAVVLSVGLRPCSGAVLVLVLAEALGLPWAGLWSVAAMSAGTAATVAALALLTVGARRWAGWLVRRRAAGMERAAHLVALAGGGFIAATALSLLAGSFGPRHPLGL